MQALVIDNLKSATLWTEQASQSEIFKEPKYQINQDHDNLPSLWMLPGYWLLQLCVEVFSKKVYIGAYLLLW